MTDLIAAAPLGDAAKHPLAHRSGLTLLGQALSVVHLWTSCTRTQRDVLRALRPALREAVVAAPTGGTVVLPQLPESVHPQTLAALQRRGLVDGDRLTWAGGLVVQWWAET